VSGRDAFRKAASSADFDLIFIDLNILRWELSETVANLKSDSRTSAAAVYLVGPLEWSSVADRYAERYGNIRYVVRPTASQDLALQLQNKSRTSLAPLSSQERLDHAQRALHWLYQIASGEISVGDARQAQDALEDALEEPELASDALPVLAMLSTPEAQQALVEVTLDERRPSALRRAAADGLCYGMRKFGVLITPQQVEGLERLFETSTDPELHSGVSAVIGCMRRAAPLAGRLLPRYRPPSVPAAPEDVSPSDSSGAAPPNQGAPSGQP
jgi:hypothetical protein